MQDLGSVVGLNVQSSAIAVRTRALGGQMAEPGWPTQALLLAAELDYRAGVAGRILQRTHGIQSPTVREAVVHIPVGDTGLSGKVLEYTIHAAVNAGHPDVINPINEAAALLGLLDGVSSSTLLLMEGTTERRAAMIDAVQRRVAGGARVMTGLPGQPPLLTDARVADLYASFRDEPTSLAPAIRQLGKADLLLSDDVGGRWLGVSLKSRRSAPERHAGIALAVTADSKTPVTEIVRSDGLVVVHLGDASTLLSSRHDATAGWRHAHDIMMGVAHLHPVGQRARSIGRFLAENEDSSAFGLAAQLWGEAGLSSRPPDIKWDEVPISTKYKQTETDELEVAGVV